jgi:prepilin-type N-terminal cleavage/methylation domain-containing protein
MIPAEIGSASHGSESWNEEKPARDGSYAAPVDNLFSFRVEMRGDLRVFSGMRSLPSLHHASGCRRARRIGAAFTLVELLVVIAVMLILLVMAVPAFNGIGRGTALNGAGNSVSNLVYLARQNSLAKNALTAVILPGASGTDADFHAFALYEAVPHADGTPITTADWKPLGAWQTLPVSVIVEPDLCTFTKSSSSMTPAFPAFTYHAAPVTAYAYVVFLPSGEILGSVAPQVRLVTGYLPAGSDTVVYTNKNAATATPADYYNITIISASGRVKVDRP